MVLVGESEDRDRFRSMSLQTLPNTKREYLKTLQFGRITNRLDDIHGAHHDDRYAKFQHKPNFVDNSDIKGSKSLTLHRTLNKVDRQLLLDDIEGAKPRPKTFKTTRKVNPLVPEYKLPSFRVAPPPEPKFLRDNIDNSDIDGAHIKPLHKWEARDSYLCNDIEGAQAGWKPRHEAARKQGPPHEIMKTDDIVFDGVFHSRRRTNPLAPSYDVNGMHIEDDPRYSRPKRLPKRKNCPFFSLCTEDIEGTSPGSLSAEGGHGGEEARRTWRNTNFVGDIVGAQADTVVHSIRTMRHVNPLNPTYISLDGEKLANPITPLYKDPASMEAELQLQSHMQRAAAAQLMNNNNSHAMHGGHRRPRGGSRGGQDAADARDAEIDKLTREVESLRASASAHSLPSPSPPSSHSHAPPAQPTPPPRAPQTKPASPPADFFVAPQPPTLEPPLPSGIFLRTESQGPGSAAERLVLRSSDGRPRVTLSAAEEQAARVTVADVEAVRSLR